MLFITGISQFCLAQNPAATGTFNSNSFRFSINKKWSWFVETEFRSLSFFQRFHYTELKAGVTYKYSPAISLSLGNGIYNTFNGGPYFDNVKTNFDYRLWQQGTYKHSLGLVSLEHRIRIEEVMEKPFRVNARYRLQAKAGLNKKELDKGTLFASVFDEVFFKTKDPFFYRNRFQAGLGYIFSPTISAQLGYIRQNDFLFDLSIGKNYLYYGLSFKF